MPASGACRRAELVEILRFMEAILGILGMMLQQDATPFPLTPECYLLYTHAILYYLQGQLKKYPTLFFFEKLVVFFPVCQKQAACK